MISPEDRRTAVALIREAVASGARKWKACEVLGISVRTCRRWERDGMVDRRKGSAKTVVRKLTPAERQEVIYVTPAQRGSGEDLEIYERRNRAVAAARSEHPERWVNGVRHWKRKDVVILNPKNEQSSSAA